MKDELLIENLYAEIHSLREELLKSKDEYIALLQEYLEFRKSLISEQGYEKI